MELIFIKNMVCDRCILSVKGIFEKQRINPIDVKLGVVTVNQTISHLAMESIDADLKEVGFQLVDNATPVLVNNIKSALIGLFNKNEIPEGFKLSTFLSEKFPYDYSHISRVFSHNQNYTIEHYLIELRIEKAKELLLFKDINISEVAFKLGYSSNAHFSRQFKKLVGISPSKYQNNPTERRSLEDI